MHPGEESKCYFSIVQLTLDAWQQVNSSEQEKHVVMTT